MARNEKPKESSKVDGESQEIIAKPGSNEEVLSISQSGINVVSAFKSRMTSGTDVEKTGRPCHEFKKGTNEYTAAQALGTDLSAIQPIDVPPSCRFQVADAEDEWTFPNKFDMIHGQALLPCFKDPKIVLRHAFKALAPGGYLEMHDGTFHSSLGSIGLKVMGALGREVEVAKAFLQSVKEELERNQVYAYLPV
ncbi:uncharacterized protein PAC_02562 [Phialocephala subalpina]|uniref:Uncharacterized protein n=1 Tax=Phialocephala subalpina TaxID=576137 RepID=A0A1L7WIT9_9HELO|nr:uncharacterized protein PAC_02562 [Phialocephala subalpina]